MRSFIIAAIALAASAQGLANNYGPAGCGLGTEVVFKDANEWHEHVLAATTNGTSGNQTFGMTSGTLGCDVDGPLAEGVSRFVDEHLEQIAADAAQGQGESLDALAELIGVADKDKDIFASSLQANFDSIFASSQTTSQDTYEALVQVLKSNTQLAQYVS